ncbi:hypothetical protein [Mycoplasma sp. P36-A1]|uniref:hypothetical protein n=1 Tax=Mycoplasma sp. P36-A1 TaxID=3252900 RepID=UPI003C2B35FE
MERSNKGNHNSQTNRQIVSTLSSLGGYMAASVLIGMYLDDKFFNNNGIAVIVTVLLGILFVILGLIRLVVISRDN